ncbi:adenylate isopentenyltransferase 3, chloroplastic-like [Nicotiana tabacum]|uniref:adenylate dimethylallyltransferase (ADP/ATP-dependent) n=2 Tax=Nicotiana TaxID=4085 RepID=A0A1S4A916_TOBAC|nr:PREDICTED: adenylate isopentenyltransferase 3, chloroplastic [Nicotiana sylvestris]XP_016473069.1 PREDICTED: adenylate isopentenyltransferase 3, chloroplastic-like [Nicotiana tabacum]
MIGMRNSSLMCKQVWPTLRNLPQKDKVVFVMGVTGAGKSRLSIDLATQFRGEIVNSDKIQVYKGLDIATNKITQEERCGVPHHLLGVIDPYKEFTTKNFCNMASLAVNSITDRGKLPIIVGGSNSFIEALVHDNSHNFRTRYDCCFLWVDVSMNVLNSFLYERVDKMMEQGMTDEVRSMFNPKNTDYTKGIRKAIGVPEFDSYFRAELSNSVDVETRERLLKEAINEVKINNCILASKQLEKIKRLINVKGWKIQRLDATEVFRRKQRNAEEEAEEIWKNMVMGQSIKIVGKFLCENNRSKMVYRNDVTAIKRAAASAIAQY